MIDREMARLCAQGRIVGWSRDTTLLGRYRLWVVELSDGSRMELRATQAWAFVEGALSGESVV
jgi:hypothetical protein